MEGTQAKGRHEPERTVTITFPALGGTAKIMPPNLVEKCLVTAIDGNAPATSVVGKSFPPNASLPNDPPLDATDFSQISGNLFEWQAFNLRQGCVGSSTKKCTIKVWVKFQGASTPTTATRDFVGTSGGAGTMVCP